LLRKRFGLFASALASAFAFSRRGRVGCVGLFTGIRVLSSCFKRRPCAGRNVFSLASAFALSRRGWVGCSSLFAGIRAMPSCSTRRPCAGRHLLFFAAAKKSRQKKAAHTVSSCYCLRAPKGSYASHGNHVTHVRCQRSCGAPHPLRAPASQRAAPDIPPPPKWQTVCRPSRHTRLTPDLRFTHIFTEHAIRFA
jgi:hypothetical protein